MLSFHLVANCEETQRVDQFSVQFSAPGGSWRSDAAAAPRAKLHSTELPDTSVSLPLRVAVCRDRPAVAAALIASVIQHGFFIPKANAVA